MPSDYNAMLDGVVEGVQFLNGIAQDKEYKVDENGCIGEVCGLAPVQENKDNGETTMEEKCPIQEKIDAAVKEAKDEIYSNINNYLEEAFGKVKSDREKLIENISDFLSPDEVKIDETNDELNIGEKLLKALKEKEEQEAKEVEKAKEVIAKEDEDEKCSECGKESENLEKGVCPTCKEKEDGKVDEGDFLSKLKREVFKS